MNKMGRPPIRPDWCSYEDYQRFSHSRKDAKRRGILFLLTIEEWWDIWQRSGHYEKRGNRHGQYQMARFGDNGPYERNNVRIITREENVKEKIPHRPFGNKSRTGMKNSKSSIRKMRASLKKAWLNRNQNGFGLQSESLKKAWLNRDKNGFGSRRVD